MSFVKSTNVITDVALTVSGLTGGTNGKIVRINGTNTVTDADSSDTSIQLNNVLIKINDIYYSWGISSRIYWIERRFYTFSSSRWNTNQFSPDTLNNSAITVYRVRS